MSPAQLTAALCVKKGESMHKVRGVCHCGNISCLAEFPNELSTYTQRACGCKFCTIHSGSYVSDSNGTLTILIRNDMEVSKYTQGSRLADFIICKQCGVMTNVLVYEKETIYGSINVRSA